MEAFKLHSKKYVDQKAFDRRISNPWLSGLWCSSGLSDLHPNAIQVKPWPWRVSLHFADLAAGSVQVWLRAETGNLNAIAHRHHCPKHLRARAIRHGQVCHLLCDTFRVEKLLQNKINTQKRKKCSSVSPLFAGKERSNY